MHESDTSRIRCIKSFLRTCFSRLVLVHFGQKKNGSFNFFHLLLFIKDGEVSLNAIRQLFDYHDKDHWIFKRISAGDDPKAYHNSAKLLSFHGFVR